MRLLLVLPVLFFQSVYVMANRSEGYQYIDYKIKSCTSRDASVSFWFSTEDKKSRHFALSVQDKRMFLSFSGGKGSLNWDAVERITYFELNDDEGYIALSFVKEQSFLSKEKFKVIEFGVMNRECWEILTENVGQDISTEIKKNNSFPN